MSSIDRQRISAVKTLEGLGFTFTDNAWQAPGGATTPSLSAEADAMHSLLVLRADKLGACTEGSDEAAELAMLSETVRSYEAKRWPDGNVPGGKA
jgi:hypothetical protein